MSLGKKLAALRKNSNMTQEALGKQLDMSAQAISKWENDLSEPDMATIKKLATIYNVPIAEFYDAREADSEPEDNNEKNIVYEVVLSEFSNTLAAIKHIRNSENLSLVEAKNKIESLRGSIQYTYSEDEAKKIKASLDKIEGAVTKINKIGLDENQTIGTCSKCGRAIIVNNNGSNLCESCKGNLLNEEINRDALKSIFIIANVTAAIPALAWLIFAFCNLGSTFLVVLQSLAWGIGGAYVIFSTIFQLHYKTLPRSIITLPIRIAKAVRSGVDGCIMFIIYIAVYLVALIASVFTIAIGACIAPFTYPVSLKKRIKNLKKGDEDECNDIIDIVND